MALRPASVTTEPYIYVGRTRTGTEIPTDRFGAPIGFPDDRGDIAVHGFWSRGQTAIFDVRVTDTDAPSYRDTDPVTVLENQERGKKRKYLDACLARRRSFTPLVFSVDGMRAGEADRATKRLALLLSTKWRADFSQMF